MLFNQINSSILSIFCLLSVVPGSVLAMNTNTSNSDLHFYGNQRRGRSRSPKITTNSTAINEHTSPASSSAKSSDPMLTPSPIEMPRTYPSNDLPRNPSLDNSSALPVLANKETLSDSLAEEDNCTIMYRKLSNVLTDLQADTTISTHEKRESFILLKLTAQEWVRRSLEESPLNVLNFSTIITRAFSLTEKIDQDLYHECLTLQTQCFKLEPHLDDVD